MADQVFNKNTGQFYTPGGGANVSQQGAMAGQDARFNDIQLKELQQQFLKEMGWAGLGNRNRPANWMTQFQAWLTAKSAPPQPAPSPSPAASPSPMPVTPGSLGSIIAAPMQQRQ